MKPRKAKRHWENFAAISPYYAVASEPRFAGEINEESRAAFFTTGEQYVNIVFDDIRAHLSTDFRPRKAMDFGCGVGRIVLALASRCGHVVGVDIAEGMIQEAQANTSGRDNVSFIMSGDLSDVKDKFDFIHSIITLQHIHPKVGLEILKRMIGLLEDKGVAAIQFTYASNLPTSLKIKSFLHASVPFAHTLINLLKGRPSGYPYVQMHEYNLNDVFRILQTNNCEHFFTGYTNHFGQLGLLLYFQKRSDLRPSL